MEKIRLAIVGCGGMGHRHLRGLAELHRAGLSRFELVGACDPVQANAQSLADEAAEHFGQRPTVAAALDALTPLDVQAVDVTTTPRYHHPVVADALARDWHVMVEKPMGLTARACNLILKAAAKSDRVVSVAENYRRDPVNRLARALLDGGVIGRPRLMLQQSMGGADRMTISVWRHQKDQSGLILDVGVHYTDMMEYLLGEIETIYAQTRLYEPIRKNPAALGEANDSNPAGVYGKWQKEMPAEFEATAEDAAYATLTFKSGAVAQYIEDHAAHGEGGWKRQIHGSRGSMDLPNDRSGRTITLNLGGEVIDDGRILDLAPDFRLNDVTAALFNGDRLWRYDFPFPETDRKLIAVEYGEFASAILDGGEIEVDVRQGARSVAVSYAILESGQSGRMVTTDEVLSEQVDAYQRDINDGLGI
jgi:predicted dehydrogenase